MSLHHRDISGYFSAITLRSNVTDSDDEIGYISTEGKVFHYFVSKFDFAIGEQHTYMYAIDPVCII